MGLRADFSDQKREAGFLKEDSLGSSGHLRDWLGRDPLPDLRSEQTEETQQGGERISRVAAPTADACRPVEARIHIDENCAEPGARANATTRHAGCWRTRRAAQCRGSSLAFGTLNLLRDATSEWMVTPLETDPEKLKSEIDL